MKIKVFYGDCVRDIKNDIEYQDKNEVMLELLNRRNLSTTKYIKKEIKEKSIAFELKFDDEGKTENHIIAFRKEFIRENREYIRELDRWVRNYRKQSLKNLKKAAILCAITITGTSLVYEPVSEGIKQIIEKIHQGIENLDDLFTDEVKKLEWDILVHSGHAELDDRFVNPYYDHGCVFVDDKSLSVQERISLYCKEHDLEYLEDAAIQKYEYLYNNEMELANSIDLKELEKQHQKSLKQ